MPHPPLAAAFLSPTFAVAGLCLAGLPIVIHLLNRRRYKVVEWAAMAFLMRAMRRNRRRVRFEQWLLLACRCLLLALLGTALARPLGCGSSSVAAFGGRTGLHVLIVDNGFTMAGPTNRPGAKTHLDEAKKVADGIIDRLSSGGESVVVITAARPAAAPVPKPTYDLQQARAIVSRVPQTYAAVDLAEAVRLAVAVGRENERQPNKNVYLLTDGAAAAWQPGDAAGLKAAAADLAKLYRVVHFDLSSPGQWNQAVTAVRPTADLVTTNPDFAADFVATVRGYGPSRPAVVQWKVDGKLMPGGGPLTPTPTSADLAEGRQQLQSAIVNGGPHVVSATVAGDDPMQADNTASRVVNVVAGLKTLVVEGQHSAGAVGGSGTNLTVALSGLGKAGRNEGFAAPDLISDLELGNRVLADYRAVVLCGVAQVSVPQADQLKAFVEAGGTLMVFLGDNVSAENYNAALLPRHLTPGPLTKRVAAGETDAGFYFDFNPDAPLHPLLRAFAHQQNTGLENAQAFGYWQCDVPADDRSLRVLNWKGTGPPGKPDPAVTQQAVGRGRVVFVTTAANEPWITFDRKPVYTELVNELLGGSVNAGDAWMNLTVGQPLEVPASVKLTGAPTLLDPGRAPLPLAAVGTAYRSEPLAVPGLYTLSTGGKGGDLPVAVNVPADAVDCHAVGDAAVKAALGGIDVQLEGHDPPAVLAAAGSAGDQGWNVMLVVLLLVGAEAFLAMRFGHHAKR